MVPSATGTTFDALAEKGQMLALLAEWEDVLRVRQSGNRARQQEVVASWETRIHELKAEQREIEAAGSWVRGPSDLLSILGRERRETYHSKVLAWLLDPLAPHGLGSAFLGAFLAACDPAWDLERTPESVVVRCEEARATCRADIVVWTDAFTLVVENKVDAAEGSEQCDRIYTDFKDEVDPRFVFLTPSGERPRTATGDARESFRTASYRSLKGALSSLLQTAPHGPATGRTAAEGYLLTLQTQF